MTGLHLLAALGPAPARAAPAPTVEWAGAPPADATALPMAVSGRTVAVGGGDLLRQWPGTYFETAFDGAEAGFRVGPGDVSLRIGIDGRAPIALVRPAAGYYRLAGLAAGAHRVRIDVANESQAAPTLFGGFRGGPGTRALPIARRARRIEFVGDSHTVGYGDLSPTGRCSDAEVWERTDTGRGLPGLLAARYGADYQVNAISGRGVVRNYGGFAAPTLPRAYPYALFDRPDLPAGTAWRPQLIVVALGTNDFSTPLRPRERWRSRARLRADYEATYAAFVRGLRRRAPDAAIVLWSTEDGDGEIRREAGRVAARLVRAGDRGIGFVAVPGLAFSACHHHPGIADDQRIADAIAGYVDGRGDVWRDQPAPGGGGGR